MLTIFYFILVTFNHLRHQKLKCYYSEFLKCLIDSKSVDLAGDVGNFQNTQSKFTVSFFCSNDLFTPTHPVFFLN